MKIIEWKDEYSVGIPVIDKQHMQLIDMINKLNDAMSEGKGKKIIADVLSEMINYTVTHFTHEERMLERNNYPDLIAHKRKHNKFVEKIKDFEEGVKNREFGITIKIIDYLKEWLIDHIQGTDMKYANYFEEKGIT